MDVDSPDVEEIEAALAAGESIEVRLLRWSPIPAAAIGISMAAMLATVLIAVGGFVEFLGRDTETTLLVLALFIVVLPLLLMLPLFAWLGLSGLRRLIWRRVSWEITAEGIVDRSRLAHTTLLRWEDVLGADRVGDGVAVGLRGDARERLPRAERWMDRLIRRGREDFIPSAGVTERDVEVDTLVEVIERRV